MADSKDSQSSVHDFIWKLEASAKRVLKDANKKAREAQIAEQTRAIIEGKKTVALAKSKSAKGMLKEGSTKMRHTQMSSSQTMDDVKAMGRAPPGTDTLEMRYSVPQMFVSMAIDSAGTVNFMEPGNMPERASSSGTNGFGGTGSGHLSPIKKKQQQQQHGGGSQLSKSMTHLESARETKTQPLKRNKVLEALNKSAYVSEATGTVDEIIVARRNEQQKLRDDKKNPKAQEKETTSQLKSQVTEVLSGKSNGATKLHRKLLKQRKDKQAGKVSGTRKNEQQGPIDWSTNGLKLKYRGEAEREAAYRSWETANAYSQDALEDQAIVIPIAKIDRHPLFVQFYDHIKGENNGSTLRTRARLLMKRFVFDVHEVWLTNLQHLREHQPARLMQMNNPDAVDAHGHELGQGESKEEQGNGLNDRRDKRAIESMEAQIQSVSQKRSLKNAYYTTHMPETKTVLNFVPAETPSPIIPRTLPPSLEVLVDGLYVKTIDAATSIDPNNKRVGIPEIAVFVERLLPPPDARQPEPGQIHAETLWRFSAYRREDVSMLYYITTEKEIIQFSKHLDQLEFEAEGKSESKDGDGDGKVYKHEDDFDLPWAVMDIGAVLSFYVGRKGGEMGNIQIKIVAHLLGDYDGDQIVATVSPIELRYILQNQTIPLNDSNWWTDPARKTDIWKSIMNSLFIKDGHVNEFGDPEPQEIGFTAEKTAADRVPGALTTGAALAMAQGVLCAVRVDSKCRLHLQGGSKTMWLNADDTERRFLALHLDNEDNRTNVSAKRLTIGEMNEYLRIGNWDKVLDDRCSTLSMIASGALNNIAMIPGTCEIGKMGTWESHLMSREYTQACASFYRDPKVSTTDTVLVNMTLALDTSQQFPVVLAWEDFSQLPPKCVAEEIDGVVPAILAKPDTLCIEALISPLDQRSSETAGVFTTIPEPGVDHMPLDAPNCPPGMMRQWPFIAGKSFRKKIEVTLLGVDPVLPTVVFGITRYGAQPNVPGVNSRNIWHSTLAITEHINRPRASKDYHYYLANIRTHGANDPTTFTTTMKAGECVGLSSSAFRTFEKDYEEIKLRRDIFARQLALDTKIENSVIAMKTKEAALKSEMQKELQMAIEKKMRKATKSEKGWSKRFYTSTLIEVQHNWERRLDEKSGTIFFRAISGPNQNLKKEKFLQTCQWEVPSTWDGDPLALEGDEYGPDDDDQTVGQQSMGGGQSQHSMGSGVGSSITGAWEQPPDSWHPGMDNQKPVASDGKTPGESQAATIDTANLEHIAEQLVSSDELMRVLAKRLGLPDHNIVPAEELSVFSVSLASAEGGEMSSAGRNGAGDDFDSDDDLWSDEEQEVGDGDEDMLGELPQDHFDVNTIRKRKMREGKTEDNSVPDQVPFLNLRGITEDSEDTETGAGWRKLARPDIPEKFFDKCMVTQTLGPDKDSCNTFNTPVFLMPISPVDACQYEPDNFEAHIESIFIPDAKKDMERSLATVERNIKREEDLAKNVATDDLLLFGSANENTKADTYIAKQYKEDQNAFVDPKEGAMRKAILAAKSNNIAEMEDALEVDISVNTADAFGNTLLILAAQQGSKRMCKFLLRRGANINLQALSGNTCLHYCYAYSQFALAEYLKSKGADDSVLNIDKMTCYEGLSNEALREEGEESDGENESEY
eukprot:GSChrysophyteH2.ASY1.ANO1.566.1 assembled CDS